MDLSAPRKRREFLGRIGILRPVIHPVKLVRIADAAQRRVTGVSRRLDRPLFPQQPRTDREDKGQDEEDERETEDELNKRVSAARTC
jgi:hypothetical protein